MIAALFVAGLVARAQAPRYTSPGTAAFSPSQHFRSVGVFGSFGKDDKLEERDFVGLLAFMLKKDLPRQTILWPNFDDGKDRVLGQVEFPGARSGSRFLFDDWTTARQVATTEVGAKSYRIESVFSRLFPAVRYSSEAPSFRWIPSGLKLGKLGYRQSNGRIAWLSKWETVGRLGAPWLLLWNGPAAGEEGAPLLIRFEKRPKSVRFGDALDVDFDGPAGGFAVMPLMGIRRVPAGGTAAWAKSPPPAAVKAAEFWSRALAAFPAGVHESSRLTKDTRRVTITDTFAYLTMRDDWGTQPLFLAPVPPVTAIASANGYSVEWHGKAPIRDSLATFLGPFAYSEGRQVSYTIPVPSGRDNMLTPTRTVQDPARSADEAELNRFVREHLPTPGDTSDGGLDLQVKEYSQAFPLLDSTTRHLLAPKLAESFHDAYQDKNLQTVVEPVTGQRYVMSNRIWCVNEPYDREWYTGRQLDLTSEYAAWVSPADYRQHWKAIQGLYAYYRIYNDWAWSGTLSSVFAYALCGDGMNFAMEGMLATARMARESGDRELFEDASYRAAKQAVCTFSSFFLPAWVSSVDYVTWTDTSYDYEAKKGRYVVRRMAPRDTETRFGLDIFSDTTGIKVLRPGMFWHSVSGFYWNNPSLYRLYAENLEGRARRWEYETMPRQHPLWFDGAAIEKFGNSPYGNNHAIAHLDARRVLFGEDQAGIARYTTKLRNDFATLYKLRLRQDLLEAGSPQFWAPIGAARVRSSVWDASKKTLSVAMEGHTAGQAAFDWIWRGHRPGSARLNGKQVRPRQVAGGYWRIETPTKPGRMLRLEVRY